MPSLGTPSSQHFPLYSPSWKLSKPHALGIFMEASSCKRDELLTSLQSFSHSWRMGVRSGKFQASNHGVVSLVTSQKPSRNPPRFASLEQKTPHHPGNYKGFRSSVSGTGAKDQILEPKILSVLITWEIRLVVGALCQGPVAETNICIFFYFTKQPFLLLL